MVIRNEHGEVEFAFKFYVTVEGGMDFRAMLMKRKVKQKKIVVKTIEWLEVNNLLFTIPPFLNIVKRRYFNYPLLFFYLVDQQCCDARNFQNKLVFS